MKLLSGETLRILLVSSLESVRDEVGQALLYGAGDHRLYWVAQPELAATRAQDLAPHVILIDDALIEADPVSLTTQLVTRAPSAAVLALVEEDAIHRVRQALLAGARGFVTKPLQPEELVTTVRQVLARTSGGPEVDSAQKVRGRVIVFCAPKGGTGRTTLAINTAISLHAVSKDQVALVDADYASPAIDVALSLPADRTVVDLLPRLARLDDDLISGVLVRHASGIRVLLAPPPADLSGPMSLPQVQQVLVGLKRLFPWVVVDLGLPLDETAFAFLDGADRIVLSVLPEMVGLRNTRLMLDQIHDRGYSDEKVWVVLNRATIAGGIPVADIERRLRVVVKHTIPDDQPLATYSINRGVPLTMSHSRSAVARAVQQFAQRLTESVREEHALETNSNGTIESMSRGLMGRLRTISVPRKREA